MKNISFKIIFFLIGLVFMTACDKERLNLDPISSIGDSNFYLSNNEVEGAVIAIYDGLQQVPIREFALTEMRSDNAKASTNEGDWAQFQQFSVKPTNTVVGSYWAANYNVIFRANRVLENLDVVTDAASKNQFEGEAKFLRALAHFNLVRAYGGVPILDKVIIQTDRDYFDKDLIEDVYTFIQADLLDAVTLLSSAGGMEFGRATVGAAKGILAKVYLTLHNYSSAEALLADLVGSSQYSLLDDYEDVFYSEGNSEILFAIPYSDDDVNESQDFSFEMTKGGSVSGLNFLTDGFIAAMDPADTERNAINVNSADQRATGKFLTASSDLRLCGNDWIVLRFADVQLMYAEALMAGAESTNSLDAIASYNDIRDRVGLSTLAEDGTATLTKEMLLMERRMELAFENHRLYDLIRFGVAMDVLTAHAATLGATLANTDLILPIPQAEINVSFGLLLQNPGYIF